VDHQDYYTQVPHTNNHGDTHTNVAHTNVPHEDHNDTIHQNVAHGNVTHQDTPTLIGY
jgi:hypothetical protein